MVNKQTNKSAKPTKRTNTRKKTVEEEKVFAPIESVKSIFKSRTFWVNLIGFISVFLENQYGFGIDPGIQIQILAVVNIVLRTITKEKVVWKKPKHIETDEE